MKKFGLVWVGLAVLSLAVNIGFIALAVYVVKLIWNS